MRSTKKKNKHSWGFKTLECLYQQDSDACVGSRSILVGNATFKYNSNIFMRTNTVSIFNFNNNYLQAEMEHGQPKGVMFPR